jgi:hypothetical protein
VNNEAVKIFDSTSAGSAVTPKAFNIDNPGCTGLDLVIDITDENLGGGAGSLTVTLEGVDPYGKAYTIIASAALVAIAKTIVRVGRGLTAAANLVANSHVPAKLRVTLTHGNANPMVYTIGLNLVR